MSLDSNKIWAAVSLKPNQIHKAEVNLQRQGIDFLAPKVKVTKRQKHRFINKINLLFPGYIFVHINPTTGDTRKVQSTYGVSQILKVGGQIGRLPENFIEALKAPSRDAHPICAGDVKPGDNIEIMHGPFAGLIAEIVELDSASRVKCLFNLMEGKINLSIASEDFVLVT